MIFLLFTGYCGTGKSTVARAISQRYALPLLEERQLTASIAANYGFEGFSEGAPFQETPQLKKWNL